MRKALRWTGRGLLVLLLLLILAGFGGYAFLRGGLPQSEGDIVLAGLDDSVEILRDGRALVTIRAKNERDSFFALGFVHAQDRLGQMEMTRRIGQGRLSEVAGEATLDFDKLMRLLRIYDLAEDSLAQISAQSRRSLEAYTAGVNAYLQSHGGAWPPEFYLLGITEPEAWKPVDSLIWGKLMALQLSGDWRSELRRARLKAALDPQEYRELFPDLPESAPTTLGGLIENDTLLAALPPEMRNLGASNAWSLTADRTASGAPLLANDPHLRLQAPPQWYLVRIETPQGVRAGATAPGVPVIVIGHNGTAAWGFTTTHSDTQDLIVEKLDPEDPSRYQTPDGARAFETRSEKIPLRGGESVGATFRYTRHGPVISDHQTTAGAAEEDGQVIALAWPGLQPGDTTAQAFFELNEARTWPAFRAAVSGFVAPQQNIFYADVNGAIGFIAPAKVPIREGYDGSLPTSGWDKEKIWSGFIPFAELPQAINPPSGQFVNANNKITPPDYPYELASEYELPFRAQRIEALLGARKGLTLEDMQSIQTDVRSLM
ncbi:MAG: penicillin acylase family protein, partial [Rhodovibrionaceae bacterium]